MIISSPIACRLYTMPFVREHLESWLFFLIKGRICIKVVTTGIHFHSKSIVKAGCIFSYNIIHEKFPSLQDLIIVRYLTLMNILLKMHLFNKFIIHISSTL